jgi:hypothetical protein
MVLSGLVPRRIYQIRVRSRDKFGASSPLSAPFIGCTSLHMPVRPNQKKNEKHTKDAAAAVSVLASSAKAMLGSWGMPKLASAPSSAPTTANANAGNVILRDDDDSNEFGAGVAGGASAEMVEKQAAEAAVEWVMVYGLAVDRQIMLARMAKMRTRSGEAFVALVTESINTCVVGTAGYIAAQHKASDLAPPPPAPSAAPTLAKKLRPVHHKGVAARLAPVMSVGQATFMSALASWTGSACGVAASASKGHAGSSSTSNGDVDMSTAVELAWNPKATADYNSKHGMWTTRQGRMRTCTLEDSHGKCLQLSTPAYRVLGLTPATSYVFKARCLCRCAATAATAAMTDPACKFHVADPDKKKHVHVYKVCSTWGKAVGLETSPMPS